MGWEKKAILIIYALLDFVVTLSCATQNSTETQPHGENVRMQC